MVPVEKSPRLPASDGGVRRPTSRWNCQTPPRAIRRPQVEVEKGQGPEVRGPLISRPSDIGLPPGTGLRPVRPLASAEIFGESPPTAASRSEHFPLKDSSVAVCRPPSGGLLRGDAERRRRPEPGQIVRVHWPGEQGKLSDRAARD